MAWVPPSRIIFERQNLPQQITYRWKGNLTENTIRFKYSDFLIFVRFRPVLKDLKQIKLLECEQIIYYFKARDLEIPNIYIFCEIFNFRENMSTLKNFAKKLKYFHT